ncbi:hypothetical protein F3Y22_tig00110388pilonHSYRG00177 [Hibiscus syriacus]|uniref:ABC transporter domain-containing protein n=1 Tax=Hibiscus syriacus TaxID=106335 RepID=A0A6A3AQ25_HIBSY|nr:hypothetical protein F3Y22_tig00110388pilonHSYRG00177 [Hibiscus syriacus]
MNLKSRKQPKWQMHDFIAGLAEGYDTWCGDIDEATSALDNKSEKLVQEALERVMVRRTSVTIAHRLSTNQNCDVIVMLDQGNLAEKGNHSSLLVKGPTGAYYSLIKLQSGTHESTVPFR